MEENNGNRSPITSQTIHSSRASLSSQASPASQASQPSQAKTHSFLKKQDRWESLYFYQKTDVLYQLTFAFAQRFLQRGDRTVDQMVQAARLGYRTDQRDQLRRLEEENNALRAEVARLQNIIASLTGQTGPTSQASPANTASHPS